MASLFSMSSYARPRPLAWGFFLLGFSLMASLGVWQLQRLAWKEALIAQVEEARSRPPLMGLPPEIDADALNFRRVALKGRFATEHEFAVLPRYFRNKLGYHLFVPFTLEDGRVLMVNRGWVPQAQKEPQSRPNSGPAAGEVVVEGMLRAGADRNRFTPPSNPAKNSWFGRDLPRMAEAAGIAPERFMPLSVDLIGVQDAEHLPVPSRGEVNLRNDHLHYALTWFAVAIGILVIFAVYHYEGRANTGDKTA